MTQAKQAEPPSWLRPPLFMIGQDCRGNWVVQDQKGIRGGLFVDRKAALRFVRSENGDRPQALVMVPGVLELDMRRSAALRPQRELPVASASAGSPDRAFQSGWYGQLVRARHFKSDPLTA
jgi:hypothetical protein